MFWGSREASNHGRLPCGWETEQCGSAGCADSEEGFVQRGNKTSSELTCVVFVECDLIFMFL